MTNMKYNERREFAREWGEAMAHHELHDDEVRAQQNIVYWGRWLAAHGLTPEDVQDLIMARLTAYTQTIATAQGGAA